MNKLLRAGFCRLSRSMIFWLCVAAMFLFGFCMSIKTDVTIAIDRPFFLYGTIVGLVSAVFCGLFLGTEYAEGTIRNKLIVGHSRVNIYLANALLCVFAGFAFCVAYMIPLLTIGILRIGSFTKPISLVLIILGMTLALSIAWSCLFTLFSMVCHNKAAVSVICILCFIFLFLLGAMTKSRLEEPPYFDNVVYSIDGVGQLQDSPNPNYISGTKREIYQELLMLNPGGQAMQFVDQSFMGTWQLPLYSLLIALFTTVVGIIVFKKRDIK